VVSFETTRDDTVSSWLDTVVAISPRVLIEEDAMIELSARLADARHPVRSGKESRRCHRIHESPISRRALVGHVRQVRG